MDELLQSLLSPQQAQAAEQRAQQSGLLNLAFGLLQASQGQPGQRRPSLGQIIGQAGPVGMQAYQSSFDKTLSDLVKGMQIDELRRKRQQEEGFRQAISNAYTMRPSTIGAGEQQQKALMEQMTFPGEEGAPAEDVVRTRQALLSNINLPQERVLDQAAADRAVMDYLRVASPVEYAKLVTKEPKESFRPLSAQESKKYGLPENMAFQISSTGKISQVGQGPLVTMGPAETALQRGFGEFGVQQNTKIYTAGQNAFNNLPKIEQTIELLKSGNAKTGLGAEISKNVSRVQASFTGSKKSIKEVSDTELLDSLLGSDVFPQIGALGIGAKGLDTPAEREFLRQVMTGTISMNKDTLIRMTEIRKKYENRALETYNNAVKSGQLDTLFQYSGLPKRTLNPTIKVDY